MRASHVMMSLGLMLARSGVRASRLATTRAGFAPPAMSAAAAAAPLAARTLDERMVSEEPDVVRQSLTMRRAAQEQLDAVDRIGELTRQRSELVVEGNTAREVRKKLSPQIGKLLKEGNADEAEKLKADVAKASAAADAADERCAAIEAERSRLFNTLPNLLDPRVPDGDDEDANEQVGEWGCEGELPSDRQWHDEVATALGILDTEAAAKLSGSRFAILRGNLARLERALINFFVRFCPQPRCAAPRAWPLPCACSPPHAASACHARGCCRRCRRHGCRPMHSLACEAPRDRRRPKSLATCLSTSGVRAVDLVRWTCTWTSTGTPR